MEKTNWIKDHNEIDLSWVIATIQSIVDEIEAWTYHEDNDDAHYIYEATISAVCKEWFWGRFNKNT